MILCTRLSDHASEVQGQQLLTIAVCQRQQYVHVDTMPASEYKNTISGGLKLKGAKDAGVKKHKKKKDKTKEAERPKSSEPAQSTSEPAEEGEGALQRALADEDAEEEELHLEKVPAQEMSRRDDGKTEAQRRHEEMRRKRVGTVHTGVTARQTLTFAQLDERLKREGVKTHKERVEELNKYLSTLSEHHDMPRIGPG